MTLLTDLYTPTPLWPSPPLSAALGRPVLLKLEAFQPTGSFKARGMGAACLAAAERGARRLVCASGGNAGLAVAAAGRALGLPVTVVVFESAAPRAKELIAREGAELRIAGRDFAAAYAAAQDFVGDDGAFIHPFDDPAVWRGNATLVDEIAAAGVRPGAVALSVGGGGLLAGVVEGMRAHGWADVPVLAAETEGAASFAAAVQAGRLVSLERIDTIAATLGATTVCARALELAQQHPITPWVVSDGEALDACLRFADDHRLLVEPACGAALAPVYAAAAPLAARPREGALEGPVVVVVCGGAGVTLGQLEQWQSRLALASV